MGGKKQPTAWTRLEALVDRVLGILVAQVARGSLHQRQMPAGRAACHADAIGVDVIVLGMIADEPHRPVQVLDDFGNREPGLAAVDDGEDGVTALEKLVDRSRELIASCEENQPPLTIQTMAAPLGSPSG